MLCGEYGLDEVGNYIDKFLNINNVDTRLVHRYLNGKSSLALAFLNENNDATYDFYNIPPNSRPTPVLPDIRPDDIVIFGSMYSISKDLRGRLIEFLQEAKKRKAIIYYDPNFRKQQLHVLQELRPYIEENISYCDILRGSNEDFSLIFGTKSAEDTYRLFENYEIPLLYTANKNGVTVLSKNMKSIMMFRKLRKAKSLILKI
ncbi:MAG: hypothetical protein HC896_06140 [Bacteroidales bacterium]|nr:hypothetical protein [Bacteroidales bacterium]